MKLQTKCTWVIVGLLIIEILPVPFTSLYSLYAIRKRPVWLSTVTHALYTETMTENSTEQHSYAVLSTHDPLQVRKNCTIGLAIIFIADLLVPVIIPTALYVVRRRPRWFKKLITRLYSDKVNDTSLQKIDDDNSPHAPSPIALAHMEHKLAALERQNFHFAKSHARRHRDLPHGLK
jgi:hypothetical protein